MPGIYRRENYLLISEFTEGHLQEQWSWQSPFPSPLPQNKHMATCGNQHSTWHSLPNLLTPHPATSSQACFRPALWVPSPREPANNLLAVCLLTSHIGDCSCSSGGWLPPKKDVCTLLELCPQPVHALWSGPCHPSLSTSYVSLVEKDQCHIVKSACSEYYFQEQETS